VAVVLVTNAAIAPLLLPAQTPSAGAAHPPRAAAGPRRGLSLPEPPLARSSDTVYGMSVLDRGGRIADRATVAALGWTPGIKLRVHIARTHLTLRAAVDGPVAVKDHRFLFLPAATRHRLDLRPGDRVLLAAAPMRQTLVIYPPATLDELLAHERSASKVGNRDE
jgi:hypothetical protein